MMKSGMRKFGGCCLAAMLAAALLGRTATAEIIFSYDATTGQFPTDQGWSGFEIDTDGPLTAANTAGTADTYANAAIEEVDGELVLHLRDTLTDSAADLPTYYYPWNASQQSLLSNNGLKFTMVFEGIPTTSSGKGNVRFGFNGTVFEAYDNIDPDRTIEVLGLSAELAPNDGNFHTLVINGATNGSNYEFSYSFDGGTATALPMKSNPAPSQIESAVYFGANSSPNRGTDVYVKSIVMETLTVPEPCSLLLSTIGICGLATFVAAVRGRSKGKRRV